MKKIISLVLALSTILAVSLFAASCSSEAANFDTKKAYTKRTETVDHETNFVQIEFVGGAYIVIELYPDIAPETVANFKKLVSEKFYDGLTFHRIIPNFMIQGGDPLGNGKGGSDKDIKGEFSANGFKNELKHERGVISMARGASNLEQYLSYYSVEELAELTGNSVEQIKANIEAGYNSASSQFFIVHATSSHLDGNYASFGRVIRGIETVDAIAAVETDDSDMPLKPVTIKTISYVNG